MEYLAEQLAKGTAEIYEYICSQCKKRIYALDENLFWWCARCNLFHVGKDTLNESIKLIRRKGIDRI